MQIEPFDGNHFNIHGYDPGNRGSITEQRAGYKSYNYQRRPVTSSPNQDVSQKYNSPEYSTPRSSSFNGRHSGSLGEPLDLSKYNISPLNKQDSDFIPKNLVFMNESPNRTFVSMPGGHEYSIGNEENHKPLNRNSPPLHKEIPYSSTKKYNSPRYHQYKDTPRSIQTINSRDEFDRRGYTPSNQNYHKKSQDEMMKRMEEERDEDRKIMRAMLERLNHMEEERIREKEEKEKEEKLKEEKNKNQKTPVNPGFTIPNSDPVSLKTKIPDYESMNEIEKDVYREKFRTNYNLLKVRYPKWNIEVPDFNVLPLKIIHERYENVIKTICIYQTAMKWKVYLVVILAGIEYYVGYKKNQAWCRGLLEAQIKGIHKFDLYLVEFASMFYSDEQGDDYPLWVRFLGTFASSLATFSTINGASKSFGLKASDEFLHEADKFISPPEGTAKLHSDGISDVPEPPEPNTMQDPNSAIGGISWVFDMAKGFFGKSEDTPATATATAAPVPTNFKPKIVDDFDNADM